MTIRGIPRSGIRYSLVLEQFLAARWAGLEWFSTWDALDGDDMAFVVAAYRASNQIEAVVAWDTHRKNKRHT